MSADVFVWAIFIIPAGIGFALMILALYWLLEGIIR